MDDRLILADQYPPAEPAPAWLRRLKRYQWVHVEGPDRCLEGCVMRIGADEIVLRDGYGRMWVIPAEKVRALTAFTGLHWHLLILGGSVGAWRGIYAGLIGGDSWDEIFYGALFLGVLGALAGGFFGLLSSRTRQIVSDFEEVTQPAAHMIRFRRVRP